MRKNIFFISCLISLLQILSINAQHVREGDTLWSKNIDIIDQIQFTPDGSILAARSYYGNINLYDAETGKEIIVISNSNGRFSFSHDSRLIYFMRKDTIYGCDVHNGDVIEQYLMKDEQTYRGNVRVTKNKDILIIFHGITFNKITGEIKKLDGLSNNYDASPNSDYILVAYSNTSDDAYVSLIGVNDNEYTKLGDVHGPLRLGRKDVSMSYDGKYGASILKDICIWDIENKKLIKKYSVHEDYIDSNFSWGFMNSSKFTHNNEFLIFSACCLIENKEHLYPYTMFVVNLKTNKSSYIYKDVEAMFFEIRRDDKSLAFITTDEQNKTDNLVVIKLNLDSISNVEDRNASKIKLSPNPVTDFITINPGNEGLKPFAETDEQVEIYNSFGELVLKDVPHLQDVAHLRRIDISQLPVGLYFVKIGNMVEKFLKI